MRGFAAFVLLLMLALFVIAVVLIWRAELNLGWP